MGHTVNPISIRLGYNKSWNSSWNSYRMNNYSYLLTDDLLFSKYFLWFIQNKYLESLGLIISHYNVYKQGKNIKVVLSIYDGKANSLVKEISDLHGQLHVNSEDDQLLRLYWDNFIWNRVQKKTWDFILNI